MSSKTDVVNIDYVSELYRKTINESITSYLGCEKSDVIVLQALKNSMYLDSNQYRVEGKKYLDLATNFIESVVFLLKTKKDGIKLIRYNDSGDIYVVKKSDYIALCRLLKNLKVIHLSKNIHNKPILHPDIEKKLDIEVNEFFINGDIAKKCGIKLTRAIMLSSKPGLGKTSYLRYLQNIAKEKRLSYHCYSAAEIKDAAHQGKLEELFHKYNIIGFDDIDISTFFVRRNGDSLAGQVLSAMDGPNIVTKEPILRVFTTNESLDNMDEAFLRPGRLDTFIKIDMPNKQMRLRFINSWHEFITSKLTESDKDKIAEETNNETFAWMENIKTELFRQIVNNRKIDIDSAISKGQKNDPLKMKKMGFA